MTGKSLQLSKYGTAATADKQTSPTDTTAGRLIPTEYGYYKGNILGTVSQSGGVPTGAVFEKGGSDTDGYYIKYADGTMISWVSRFLGSILTFGSGTRDEPYRSPTDTWQFPVNFVVPPVVSVQAFMEAAAPSASQSSVIARALKPAQVDNAGRLQIHRMTGDTEDANFGANAMAIGRWY